MNERVYNNGIERLRSAERVERLELERVVDLCLEEKNISSMLDVGTGSGLFAGAFHKRNLTVAGVDVNKEMIDAAKDILPGCELKVAPAENLPFEDGSFDLVFMGVVFHEVDDYKKALSEAIRVANKTVVIYEWKYQTEDFGPPLEHRLKPEFMQELSEQAGFAKMEIVPLKNLVLYKFFK